MCVILHVECLGDTELEEVSEAQEGQATEDDSDNGRELLKQGVERQRDDEHGDQRGEEPGCE